MLNARAAKVLEWMRVAIMAAASFTLIVIFIPELMSLKSVSESYMPWWQFSLIIITVLAIFAAYMYQQSKMPANQRISETKGADAGHQFSPDMQRLIRISNIAVLVSVGITIPVLAWQLTKDVGTKKWITTLCIGCMVLACIPDWVRRAKAYRNLA